MYSNYIITGIIRQLLSALKQLEMDDKLKS